MTRSTKIQQFPDRFGASTLLLAPPAGVPTGEQEPTIVATLSPAGVAFAFAQGHAALLHKLRADCIAPTDQARTACADWHFTDPAQNPGVNSEHNAESSAGDPGLQEGHPLLPDVIGRDGQGSNQVLTLFVPANMRWFDGHFPADPILPAVVQIDWVTHFGAHCWPEGSGDGDQRRFAGMSRLKFRSVIAPDTVLRLTLEAADDKLAFRYESRNGLHATGTIRFGGDGEDR